MVPCTSKIRQTIFSGKRRTPFSIDSKRGAKASLEYPKVLPLKWYPFEKDLLVPLRWNGFQPAFWSADQRMLPNGYYSEEKEEFD
jgi:hypothetical protein